MGTIFKNTALNNTQTFNIDISNWDVSNVMPKGFKTIHKFKCNFSAINIKLY